MSPQVCPDDSNGDVAEVLTWKVEVVPVDEMLFESLVLSNVPRHPFMTVAMAGPAVGEGVVAAVCVFRSSAAPSLLAAAAEKAAGPDAAPAANSLLPGSPTPSPFDNGGGVGEALPAAEHDPSSLGHMAGFPEVAVGHSHSKAMVVVEVFVSSSENGSAGVVPAKQSPTEPPGEVMVLPLQEYPHSLTLAVSPVVVEIFADAPRRAARSPPLEGHAPLLEHCAFAVDLVLASTVSYCALALVR